MVKNAALPSPVGLIPGIFFRMALPLAARGMDGTLLVSVSEVHLNFHILIAIKGLESSMGERERETESRGTNRS